MKRCVLQSDLLATVCLIWQQAICLGAGCGADQNDLPRKTVELARRYGDELSRAVERAIESSMRPIDAPLSTANEETPLR